MEAIITGSEDEEQVAVRMAYFLDDMLNVCSDRMALLVNTGGGKFYVFNFIGFLWV